MRKCLLHTLAGILALTSCSSWILENRINCPAYLFLDVKDNADLQGTETVRIAVRDLGTSELMASDTPHLEEIVPDKYHLVIHKCPGISVSGVIGVKASASTGDASILTVPSGSQADPLFLFTEKSEAMSDSLSVKATLRKEYSRITLRFSLEDGQFPYHVAVKGNTSGLDMITGKPVAGPFRHEPEEEAPGLFSCNVPRQADRLLALEIHPKSGISAEEGFSGDIVLWDYLQRIPGFSWELENLPDITVDVDFFHLLLTIDVNGWTVAQSITLTI